MAGLQLIALQNQPNLIWECLPVSSMVARSDDNSRSVTGVCVNVIARLSQYSGHSSRHTQTLKNIEKRVGDHSQFRI